MFLLDIGNKFNENGKNIQVDYSRKYIDKSPSIIGLKNKTSVVILSLKPKESNLVITDKDYEILKISENIYLAGTGLDSDKLLIYHFLLKDAQDYKKSYGIEVTTMHLIRSLEFYLHLFSSYIGSRVIGADFMLMAKEGMSYSLVCTTEDLIGLRFRGCVIGSMKRRAQTEIESCNLEELDCNGLIDLGVKAFHKSFDPVVDKEFTLEIATISEDTNGKFYRLSSVEVDHFVQKHKDLTVDDLE